MLMKHLHSPLAATSKIAKTRLWFSLSLLVAGFYCLEALQEAFASNYVVQDDARQHVFWMQRFLDAELFPGDLIADYFQSVAPVGYSSFYRIFAELGLAPDLLNKLLPLALSLIATAYCFGIALQMLPIPIAGFWSALFLNQNLWMRDDLVSATPAAFVYPLFLAFLYYLLRRSLLPTLAAIALLGLFYPQCVFLAVGVLALGRWHWGGRRFRTRRDYRFCASGVVVAVLVLLPYALQTSEFGPVVTFEQARALPAFAERGWSHFFDDGFWDYWICGKRSGFLPPEWCRIIDKHSVWLLPPQIWASLLLPLLLYYRAKLPLVARISPKISRLLQLLLVSGAMFLLAHLFLFKLHLPNRYTEHSLRIIVAIAGGVALTIIIDTLWHYRRAAIATSLCTVILGATVVFYPSILRTNDFPFPVTQYTEGQVPELYQFLLSQPKETLVASVAPEVNSLPSFAQRPILVGGEGFVLPYHLGYYGEMTQRTVELINAQYSEDLPAVQQFVRQYGVDFWLLERTAFSVDYVEHHPWSGQYSAFHQASAQLQQGAVPALSTLQKRCSALATDSLVVLDAQCILNS